MPIIYCGKDGQYEALVDEEDYEFLQRWKWSFKRSGRHSTHIYARRGGSIGNHRRGDKRHETILMHVVVCERAYGPRPTDLHTPDHRNNDTLDNRRNNLFWATKSEQNRNQKRWKNAKKRRQDATADQVALGEPSLRTDEPEPSGSTHGDLHGGGSSATKRGVPTGAEGGDSGTPEWGDIGWDAPPF